MFDILTNIFMEDLNMSDRLVVHVEFSKSKIEEVKLYSKLREFSSPGSIVKDILKKTIPLDFLYDDIEKTE